MSGMSHIEWGNRAASLPAAAMLMAIDSTITGGGRFRNSEMVQRQQEGGRGSKKGMEGKE
jgi:hypothetical protein